MAIPPGFETDHFARGKGCVLFTYNGLRIATLICYDVEFPETMRHVAAMGAELVLVPTALGDQWGWVAQTMIPTRAYENGISFLGQSFIAAPNGQEIVRAFTKPEIIYGTIDRQMVAKAQNRLPYLKDVKVLRADLGDE